MNQETSPELHVAGSQRLGCSCCMGGKMPLSLFEMASLRAERRRAQREAAPLVISEADTKPLIDVIGVPASVLVEFVEINNDKG
jgi:hypothetical protein